MFILFSIVIAIVFLYGIEYVPEGNKDYAGKEQANAIKGFFILFLTVGHIIGLLSTNNLYPEGIGNNLEYWLHMNCNQLVVVMFLFFSGYGVSESIKKSRPDEVSGGGYIKSFPRRRILGTWLNYAIGVTVFLLLTPLTGKQIEWENLPLYYLGLRKVGNPTWYIMVILICYSMTWLIATIVKRNRRALVIYHTLMVAVAGFVLYLQMDEYWYDTIMCYALGFAYSQYKEELESIINSSFGSKIIDCSSVSSIRFLVHLFFPPDCEKLCFSCLGLIGYRVFDTGHS